MKKSIKLVFLFCSACIIMSGCMKNNAKNVPLCRVVTRIDIACKHEDLQIERHYTNNEKIESVLTYLRLLRPLSLAQDNPDLIDADIYEITVHLSDGVRRIYRQKAHRYISRDFRPWKDVDPAHAAQLYALMRHYPSDTDLPVFSLTNTIAQKPVPCVV